MIVVDDTIAHTLMPPIQDQVDSPVAFVDLAVGRRDGCLVWSFRYHLHQTLVLPTGNRLQRLPHRLQTFPFTDYVACFFAVTDQTEKIADNVVDIFGAGLTKNLTHNGQRTGRT